MARQGDGNVLLCIVDVTIALNEHREGVVKFFCFTCRFNALAFRPLLLTGLLYQNQTPRDWPIKAGISFIILRSATNAVRGIKVITCGSIIMRGTLLEAIFVFEESACAASGIKATAQGNFAVMAA